MKSILFVIFCLHFLICAPMSNIRSDRNAVITGEITCDTVFVFGGKMVFAIDYSTDRVYSARADENGYFILDSLPSGTYTVYASTPYFGNDTIHDLVIESPDSVDLTFHLSCEDGPMPYPYTYKDTTFTHHFILCRMYDSESENVNVIDNRLEPYNRIVMLEQISDQSDVNSIRYAEYGTYISDTFSFYSHPLEANMSWNSYSTFSDTDVNNSDVSVEFRIRPIREDSQATVWSESFTTPCNIEPYLDCESRKFQYELTLRTDNPFVSPIVTSLRMDYSYFATVRLVDGVYQPPRF